MPASLRRRITTAALAAALACGLAEPSLAAPQRIDRHRAADGTVFGLTVRSALSGSRSAPSARFRFTADAPSGRPDPYDGLVSSTPLALAGSQGAVLGSTIACGRPSSSAVYGTVARRVRRVVAVLAGGRTVRLNRRRPPARWRYDGWVVGRVLGGRRTVAEVRLFDAGGRRLGRAEFADPERCPGRG